MQLKIRDNQGVEEWCITIKGSFGFEAARAFLAEMKKRTWTGSGHVVFDLSEADHLESSGLGAMLLVVDRLQSKHKPLIRCGSERVWAVLHIAHMDRMFDIEAVGGLRMTLDSANPPADPYRASPRKVVKVTS